MVDIIPIRAVNKTIQHFVFHLNSLSPAQKSSNHSLDIVYIVTQCLDTLL